MAKSGRLELGDNIYGYIKSILTTVTYLTSKAIEFGEKNAKTAITPFKVIRLRLAKVIVKNNVKFFIVHCV